MAQSSIDYPGVLLTMLTVNRAADVPMPEKHKRYLDGKEDMKDGAWKRALDEHKERFGWKETNNSQKRIKLDEEAGRSEGTGGDEEVIAEGKGKGKAKEGETHNRGRKRKGASRARKNWRRPSKDNEGRADM